ncbi:RNA polymerase sigma factor [Microtetraspora malaysiensis]|uniref:RNA polymerase sigma factor n=1 Tax=Microtetraspora malaysiensis TaxID=161358 RepID=UPI003D8A03E9
MARRRVVRGAVAGTHLAVRHLPPPGAQADARPPARAAPLDDALDLPSSEPGPLAVALARADAAAVAAALGTLAPLHREVLDLAFAAEMSHAEIAKVLGIPVGTVKSRLFNARAALARALPVVVEEAGR